MDNSINIKYLEDIKKLSLYYKLLGEQAINQLEPDQLFRVLNDNSNSISIIISHLWGNMLSRWTDFQTSDGEKPRRNRDSEFDNDISDKDELMLKWNQGWDCYITAINSIKPENLMNIVYIRNESHTVLEAINRQLTHYAYHVGQIIFAAKFLTKGKWKSLSMPKKKKI